MTASSTDYSKDPDKKLANYIADEMQRYEQAHFERFERAHKYYEHWLSKPKEAGSDWKNDVHIPLTFAAEQTITPRIHSALFPNDAPVEMAVFGDTPETQGIVVRDIIRHHFRIAGVQDKSLFSISQCTLFGTGYLYAPWRYQTGYVMSAQGERTLALIANRPDVEPVSFLRYSLTRQSLRLTTALLIRRRYCDAEYLKFLSEAPQFKFTNLKQALESKAPISKGKMVSAKQREEYELLEYWGPWDESYKEGDKAVTKKAVPYWCIIVNRCVVIRSIPNPYNHQQPPFIKIKLYEDQMPSWFGVGIGEVGAPCQERTNKIVNQRLDNVDLVLNRQGTYNANDPLVNPAQLQISKPGKFHAVSDVISSIKWMDTPDVTASSYKEEEIAKADYRESTGATVPLMPASEGQHSTASGLNLLQGAAGVRFRPILRKMENELIGRVAFIFLSNLQQFMVAPEWVKVTSKNGQTVPVEIHPADIQAKIKFIPTGLSEVMNKEVLVGQLLRFKELTMNDPTVNRAFINKKIAELMGLKDIERE